MNRTAGIGAGNGAGTGNAAGTGSGAAGAISGAAAAIGAWSTGVATAWFMVCALYVDAYGRMPAKDDATTDKNTRIYAIHEINFVLVSKNGLDMASVQLIRRNSL